MTLRTLCLKNIIIIKLFIKFVETTLLLFIFPQNRNGLVSI